MSPVTSSPVTSCYPPVGIERKTKADPYGMTNKKIIEQQVAEGDKGGFFELTVFEL
jgi:hypothetical protein